MKQVIKDYPNYEITTSGRIISSFKRHVELTPRLNKGGYLYVNLYNDKGRKTKKIHRLVAETFIPNPNNLPQVNHKDGNKLNNRVENLEWCDQPQNTKHAVEHGLINFYSERRKRASQVNGLKRARAVTIMNIKTGYVRGFRSVQETARYLDVLQPKVSYAAQKGKCINDYQVWYTDTLATTMDEEP